MIKRLLPWPLLTLSLIVMWLVLNRSLGLGQIILAVIFGIGAPALLAPLRPARPRVRHPLTVIRLILAVGHDVVESTIAVFLGVLRERRQPVRSAFVIIPLELRDPTALASLTMITTVVPGTVWCELARDSSAMMLHVWDVPDEAEFITFFKRRYEQPLIRIFES
ncbi:Na+/H+ antiporter subunit E [Ottowia sp.]|uniref:Na+/H+ antiporter subunit E n=1 Tax=Ottowia sp. TaxID=1898956 RepID=UPI002C64246A|nr:Na+/H+ antiporter subunit E [Ottowia sp.]HRN74366.1 Na+/H+ antiporter subunit E [Ottowia sp.]HRQ01274.1 Na+/H+ antiporter subunit E [Ottowia sp.]